METRRERSRKPEFPKRVRGEGIPGISATIYRQERTKPNKQKQPVLYTSYLLVYSLMGKRRVEAFADLDEAKGAGEVAIKKITNGEQRVLQLTGRDLLCYGKEVEERFDVTRGAMLNKQRTALYSYIYNTKWGPIAGEWLTRPGRSGCDGGQERVRGWKACDLLLGVLPMLLVTLGAVQGSCRSGRSCLESAEFVHMLDGPVRFA